VNYSIPSKRYEFRKLNQSNLWVRPGPLEDYLVQQFVAKEPSMYVILIMSLISIGNCAISFTGCRKRICKIDRKVNLPTISNAFSMSNMLTVIQMDAGLALM
jgi:hypothetical protein